MTEAQVDRWLFQVTKEYWIESPNVSIKVKKSKHGIRVFIFKDNKKNVIPWEVWKTLSEVSETGLATEFLNGTVGQLE